MQIEMMRARSLGLSGTYQNIAHHAKEMESLVRFLELTTRSWKFKTWQQGHNVHKFEAHSGAIFCLRGISVEKEGYVGIRVSLSLGRGNDVRLAEVYVDERNGVSWSEFSNFMQMLSRPRVKAQEQIYGVSGSFAEPA